MLISTLLLVLGLAVGVVGAQMYDLRFGGVLVVPLLAILALRNFITLPVFLLSAAVAYGSIEITQRRLLVNGRNLFRVSLISGALVPVLTLIIQW